MCFSCTPDGPFAAACMQALRHPPHRAERTGVLAVVVRPARNERQLQLMRAGACVGIGSGCVAVLAAAW